MKKLWIVGVILALAGAALFAWGYRGAAGDLSAVSGSLGPLELRFDDRGGSVTLGGDAAARESGLLPGTAAPADGEERSYVLSAEGLRAIRLEEWNADVAVGLSPDGEIRLTAWESERLPLELRTEAGRLIISRKRTAGLGLQISFGRETETRLLLPEGLLCALEASSDNGDVSVRGLSLGELDLESDNGDVLVEDVVCTDCEAESDNGSVTVRNLRCAGDLDLSSDNGDVTAEEVSAGGEIELESDNGDVTVRALSAGVGIRLTSDLGDVSGSVVGRAADYTIRAQASQGKSSLPQSAGSGPVTLEVTASLGDINLRFEEE